MDIDPQEILQDVVQKREIEGAFTKQEFFDLIDEAIAEYQAQGLITDDDDIEALRAELRGHWKDIS